jgi:hypothetical protein
MTDETAQIAHHAGVLRSISKCYDDMVGSRRNGSSYGLASVLRGGL